MQMRLSQSHCGSCHPTNCGSTQTTNFGTSLTHEAVQLQQWPITSRGNIAGPADGTPEQGVYSFVNRSHSNGTPGSGSACPSSCEDD